MATDNTRFTETRIAGENLDNAEAGTGHIHKAIAEDGLLASETKSAIGIIQTVGKQGEHITCSYLGMLKFVAATPIDTPDAPLVTANSGYMRVAVTSDSFIARFRGGTNGTRSVSSGGVGVAVFNFITPVKL